MLLAEPDNTFRYRQDRARDLLMSRILNPAPLFTLHDRHCGERWQVEKFVTDKFRQSFGAEIHEFMPLLLSMRCLNNFSGVIGMRKAVNSSLFLEQYLDSGVENALAAALGIQEGNIPRTDIMEIGNLVAGRKGPSQFVFLIATTVMREAGFQWITFTATQALANNLKNLGFPMVKLADASIERLPETQAGEWGNYYRNRPQVFAGSLDAAMAIARRRPLFSKATALYRNEISQLVLEVRESR